MGLGIHPDDAEALGYRPPSVADGTVSTHLVDTLRDLADQYGPQGVVDVVALLGAEGLARPPVIDTLNDHAVGVNHSGLVIMLPPMPGPIDTDRALRLAAWIVALADPDDTQFPAVLQAVRST